MSEIAPQTPRDAVTILAAQAMAMFPALRLFPEVPTDIFWRAVAHLNEREIPPWQIMQTLGAEKVMIAVAVAARGLIGKRPIACECPHCRALKRHHGYAR
jgi:hypothetical protein